MSAMKTVLVLVLSLILPACAVAQVPEPRERFIRARDHGWVELEVNDEEVAQVPFTHGDGTVSFVRPDSCRVLASVNREPVLDQMVFPVGDVEPFAVRSGFRFPLPTGTRDIELQYLGCRGQGDQTVATTLTVESGSLTILEFDGTRLTVQRPIPDPATTIESIGRSREMERSER